jgi:hypothetical protein
MSPRRQQEPKLADPVGFEIVDSDDLARIPTALDVIATRLAQDRRWVREPDVDTEPLDSLLDRALAVVPKAVAKKLKKLPMIASELAAVAAKVRYGDTAPKNLRRSETLREELYDGLLTIGTYLDD